MIMNSLFTLVVIMNSFIVTLGDNGNYTWNNYFVTLSTYKQENVAFLYNTFSSICKLHMNLELFCVCFELQFRINVYLQNEVEQASTERGRFDELVPRTFPIFNANRSSDWIWGNKNLKGTFKIWGINIYFFSGV